MTDQYEKMVPAESDEATITYPEYRDEYISYVGTEIPNEDYHHGQLRPAVGARHYQVLRANREQPELADGLGYTYNHAPNIVYWRGTYYFHYLANPVSEHLGAGVTLLAASADGMHWSRPTVLFPPYQLDLALDNGPHQDLFDEPAWACMHQRMGFYIAPDGRLLTLGYYGLSPEVAVMPGKGNGIGRVVREIYPDGSFGPIYFVLYNVSCGYHAGNTAYPCYQASPDAGFIAACDALLADKLAVLQWWEENRDNPDPDFFSIRGAGEAFNHYTLPDGTIVGLWKHANVSLSHDGGHSWDPVRKCCSLVMSGGKIWGQRTSDGRYALAYNPVTDSTHRWPLAVTTSDDGVHFRTMLCAAGEVPPQRYWGFWRDFGLHYIRGLECGTAAPDGSLTLAYSVNKEDMWFTQIPVPIRSTVAGHVHDDFTGLTPRGVIPDWNIYSPLWAPVSLERYPLPENPGNLAIRLRCRDPYQYAKAERVFPASRRIRIRTAIQPRQNYFGQLQIDLVDRRGCCIFRVTFADDRTIRLKHGNGFAPACTYGGDWYELDFTVDCYTKTVNLTINGQKYTGMRFFGNVTTVERIIFRTGAVRTSPAIDYDAEFDTPHDLPDAGIPLKQEAVYYINYLYTEDLPAGR